MATRKCMGKTKAGKACKANPLSGKDYCSAHDPDTPASARFGSHEQATAAGHQGGRPPKPRATEVARKLVEDHVVELQRPYWLALGYEIVDGEDGPVLRKLEGGGAKVAVPFWGEVVVSQVEDLDAQIAAAEKLQDRALGRPRQAVEVSGNGGGPIQIEGDLSDPQVKEALFDAARAIDASRRGA